MLTRQILLVQILFDFLMNQIKTFLIFSSLTVAGVLFSFTPTLAFSVTFAERIDNEHTYTITLDADDSLTVGDSLIFQNLSGVTDVSASSPYISSPGNFDETSADFIVDTPTNGSITLTEVITLISPNDLNNIEYQAFYVDNGTPRVASGNISAVPFDFAPSLGIILGLCIFRLRRYLKY